MNNTPRNEPPYAMTTQTERRDGPAGPTVMVTQTGLQEPVVTETLLDPDSRVPAPTKASQRDKQKSRRAVYSFPAVIANQEARLYLKLYRVRSVKDVLEEIVLGRRAARSFRAALEADARGIHVPVHLGWSCRAVPARWPARSVLLMVGIPRNQDANTLLDASVEDAGMRARAAGAIGRFLGDAHRRGLIHGDLKLGNVFVRSASPLEFAVIDLDRARFRDVNDRALPLGQLVDLRTLLRSMRRGHSRDRLRVLAGWIRGRGLRRDARRRLLRWLACLGAWVSAPPRVRKGVDPGMLA